MKKLIVLVLITLSYLPGIYSQVITADKYFPKQTDQIVITFYADRGNKGLMGFTGDVYAHTGVITTSSISPTDWKFHTIWGVNTPETKLSRISTDVYTLTISPDVLTYYGVTVGETVLKLAFVFRSADTSKTGRNADGSDIFLDLYGGGLLTKLLKPSQSQLIVPVNSVIEIEGVASEICDLKLYVDNDLVASNVSGTITYNHTASVSGQHWIWIKADNGTSIVYDSVYYFARGAIPVADLPPGVKPGVNYIDNQSATIVLHDPPALKQFTFLIGDFNDWNLTDEHFMNRTPDGTYYWKTVTNLTSGQEYAYQFYIDGNLKIADPYTHKVLDPWNDRYISSTTYPNLKPYPTGKTTGVVSVMQTAQPQYNWEVTNFTPPAKKDLVIYEMLIRDFVATSDIKTIIDTLSYLQRLGVNAIELMPVNEFDGNISWGYNPAYYFATDKAYGTRNDFKRFIDECHKKGIAVIIDMVLNHSTGASPFVQMYFDPQAGTYGQPLPANPWYNVDCPHQPWCWDFDFNHASQHTKDFVDRVNKYWLEEFKVDGFRFDFTKGFTNVQTANQGSNYDAFRIATLKRMADKIWEVNDKAYVILEHFCENSEEKELAEYGMFVWGNMNYSYGEAAMGWNATSNLTDISHFSRGWNVPHLIGYMESHDEERLMYKNYNFGNTGTNYNTRQVDIALRRMELAATFFFTIPGPKMIWQFGELGYDMSINRCPNGTISDGCRTDPKPVLWNYYQDWRRKRVFDIYSMLIKLKKEHAVFSSNDYSAILTGAVKRIQLNHATNKVTILGNFDVKANQVVPSFQQTGTWYEFFTRQTLNVTDVNAALTLAPGEYRLYSTAEFPNHGILLNSPVVMGEIENQFSVYPNPSADGFYINLELQEKQNIQVSVYNIQGQKVATLVNQDLFPDSYEFYWNRTSSSGNRVPGGVYFVEILTGKNKSAKRVVLF